MRGAGLGARGAGLEDGGDCRGEAGFFKGGRRGGLIFGGRRAGELVCLAAESVRYATDYGRVGFGLDRRWCAVVIGRENRSHHLGEGIF